jgi:uncharacterized repeat protein (TIGR01451 family)
MTKFKTAIAALMVPFVFAASPALAADEGQIEGGSFYFVKNLTQNSSWGQTASANAGDTLVYRVRVHNFGPSNVVNVNVKATLPSGTGTFTSTATASSINSNPGSVSSNVTTVTAPNTLSYISGSTVLLDANGAQVQTLPDGVLASGVNIGTVEVCLDKTRYVQFQVKVAAPVAQAAAVAPVAPKAQPLAKTGPAENAALVAALLASLGYGYRRSRQSLAEIQ